MTEVHLIASAELIEAASKAAVMNEDETQDVVVLTVRRQTGDSGLSLQQSNQKLTLILCYLPACPTVVLRQAKPARRTA